MGKDIVMKKITMDPIFRIWCMEGNQESKIVVKFLKLQ